MTTAEKLAVVIDLLNEIKKEFETTVTSPDTGGSNPGGPGQPGQP